MRLHSFRLKLALSAVGLSGLVLAAFGLCCWVVLYRLNLERLDREIRDWGHRDLARPRPPHAWGRIADAMRFVLGDDVEGRHRFILLVKDREGSVRYVSPEWPDEIPHSAFPAPAGCPDRQRCDGDSSSTQFDDGRPGDDFGPRGPGPPPDDWLLFPSEPSDDDWAFEDRGPPPGEFFEDGPNSPGPHHHGDKSPSTPVSSTSFQTWEAGSERWRVGTMSSPDVTLAMGVNMDEFAASMRRVRNAFLLALPATLLLIALGSWLLAQRALRPVTKLTEMVEGVTAEGLDQRVAEHGIDTEFRRLIAVFNQMLGRLERSFQQAARFSADAAHELKTPLAVLQGRIEQALQDAKPDSEQEQILGELCGEVQRLKTIVQRLLLLARADSGQLKLRLQEVDLTALAQNLAEDVELMASHLEVRTELEPNVTVLADVDLIQQALYNLADNAVKYNRGDGWVEFGLQCSEQEARLTVSNSADDIPPAARDRIFERLYRADPAHSRCVDGVGLGLSLAREIVRTHGGTLVLERSEGGVTVFSVTLPSAQSSEDSPKTV